MIHNWEDVIWASGRWRGHKAAQRLCSECGIWETRRNVGEPCRGKHWEDLTHAEKVAEFSTIKPNYGVQPAGMSDAEFHGEGASTDV
jgi:hypothetical protein